MTATYRHCSRDANARAHYAVIIINYYLKFPRRRLVTPGIHLSSARNSCVAVLFVAFFFDSKYDDIGSSEARINHLEKHRAHFRARSRDETHCRSKLTQIGKKPIHREILKVGPGYVKLIPLNFIVR